MRKLRSKLVCLFGPIQKTLAYYEICPFPVNHETVMFYNTGPWTYLQIFVPPGTNTLAYFAQPLVTKKKVFMKLPLGIVIARYYRQTWTSVKILEKDFWDSSNKTFFIAIDAPHSKLECLLQISILRLVYHLALWIRLIVCNLSPFHRDDVQKD